MSAPFIGTQSGGWLSRPELRREIIEHVWANLAVYDYPSVLVGEAIDRLRKTDIQRRWNERKAKRSQP